MQAPAEPEVATLLGHYADISGGRLLRLGAVRGWALKVGEKRVCVCLSIWVLNTAGVGGATPSCKQWIVG